MADREGKTRVPTETPDPKAAARKPRDGEDRPGFDLGGATEEARQGPKTTIPGGPRTSPSARVGEVGPAAGGSGAGGGPTEGSGTPRR